MKKRDINGLLIWAEDALSCLIEYRAYGEEMRKIGRGFHPTGCLGHSIDAVINGLAEAIKDKRKT